MLDRWNPNTRYALPGEMLPSVKEKLSEKLSVVADNINVERSQAKGFKNDIIELIEGVVREGAVSDEILDSFSKVMFEYATEEAGLEDYDEKLTLATARINKAKIYVSPEIRNDIADYNEFSRHFGVGKLTNNENNISVDRFYMELADEFSELELDKDAVLGDMLYALKDIKDKAKAISTRKNILLSETVNFESVREEFTGYANEIIDHVRELTGLSLPIESEVKATKAEEKNLRQNSPTIKAVEKNAGGTIFETAKTEAEFEEEAQKLISYVEKSYKKDSPEYRLAKELVSLEKDFRFIAKRLKRAVTDFKIKSIKVDKNKVGKIAHKFAENLGFDKHIPNVSSFEDSLFSFYKMMEDLINGKVSSGNVVSAARAIANGVVEMSEAVDSAFAENLAAKLISGYLQVGKIDTKFSIPLFSTLAEKNFSCDDEILKVKESIPEKSIDELRSEGEALQKELKELASKLEAQKKKTPYARLLDAEDKVYNELISRATKAKEELASDRLERREKEQKEKLFRIVRDLRKKNAKAGPELKAEIEELFGKYDTLGISISDEGLLNLLDLKAEYEKKKAEDADFIPNKEIEKELQRLDKVQIGTMEASEVASLLEQAIALSHQIKNQNNIIENGKKKDARKAAESTVPAVNASGGMKYDKPVRGLVGKYRIDILSPVRFFKRILGYETNSGLYERVQALNDGQRKAMQYKLDFSKPFEKLVHSDNHKEDVRLKKELREFTGKHARVEKFRVRAFDRLNPDAFYKTEIELTPAMKVSLYLSIKNEDFLRHVAYGGLTIPNVELFKKGKYKDAYARGEIVAIMPSELKRVVSELTDYERAWADAAETFFNVDSKNAVNKASVDLYGYELATVEHYFPINTNKNYNVTEFESLVRDDTLEGKGFLNERIQSMIPVNIEDVTMVLDRHIKDVSSFAGLALPIRNFNAVFNARTYSTGKPVTVKEAILKTWGS